MNDYLRLRLANKDASPTYVYLLTHKGTASYSAIFKGDPDKYYGSNENDLNIFILKNHSDDYDQYFQFYFIGVSHADQSLYLFPVREKFFPTTLPTKGDEDVRNAMIQLWTDFARTG